MATAQQPRLLPTRNYSRRRGFPVPLVMGPLRGFWWDVSSGGKLARHLLGTYEREQTRFFERLVQSGQQVLDVGANTGYYTLLAARRVGALGRVVAFEPDPANLRVLREHVLANRLPQVIVLPLALGETSAVASFGSGTGSGTRRLCAAGDLQVEVRRLDDLAEEFNLAPQHVKIDVEGLELAVLRGGERLFRTFKPTIYLSTHGRRVHQACCQLLREWGYGLQPMEPGLLESAHELLCTFPQTKDSLP